MIFQQFNLVGRLDVLDNVLMGRLAHTDGWRAMAKLWSREDRAIAMAALEQIDIAALAPQRADKLSGGQQQRVAICRALVQEPEIVLADEPVASLDPRNAQIVMDALQRINRHFGLTVLCNLHSLDLARSYCDRLVGMAAGARGVRRRAGRADRRGGARPVRPGGQRGAGRARRTAAAPGTGLAAIGLTPTPASNRGDTHDRPPHAARRPRRRRRHGRRQPRPRAGLEGANTPSWCSPSCRPRTPPAWPTATRRSSTT